MSRRSDKRISRRPAAPSVAQLPWQRLRNPYAPTEVISADQVEAIHNTSMRVLEELGIEFLSDTALERLKAAGADVDFSTKLVRFDRALVEELVAKAPSEFTLTPRNPDRAVTFGGNHIAFNSVGGPPNASDLDNGRRPGNFADYKNPDRPRCRNTSSRLHERHSDGVRQGLACHGSGSRARQ
jgi:trimethylamine--corrinoid protein Co-methyltransferase